MHPEQKSRRVRTLISYALAVIALIALSGCDMFLPDPIAFTMIKGQPVVRTCVLLELSKVEITTYSGEKDFDGQIVWSASGGSNTYPSGSEFVLGQDPGGFEVKLDEGADFLSGAFEVSLDVSNPEGGTWTTSSYLEGAQFSEGDWLDGAGNPTSVPCSRDECGPLYACHNEWPIPTGYPTEPESTYVPSEPSSAGVAEQVPRRLPPTRQ